MEWSQHASFSIAASAYAMAQAIEPLQLLDVEVAMILGIDPDLIGSQISPRSMNGWQFRRLVILVELVALIRTLLGDDASIWLRLSNPALAGCAPVTLLTGRPDALPQLCHLLRQEMGG